MAEIQNSLQTGGYGNVTGVQQNADGSVFDWNVMKYIQAPTEGWGSGSFTPQSQQGVSQPVGMLSSGNGGQSNEFMQTLNFILPTLQKMNIPMQDFLNMWMGSK